MAIIAISRQSGSLGHELADFLAAKLSCNVITREYAMNNYLGELTQEERNKLEESAKHFLHPSQTNPQKTYKDLLIESLHKEASEAEENGRNLIILGMGGSVIIKDIPSSLSVRILAGENTRIDRIAKQYKLSQEDSASTIKISDRKHKRFVSTLFDIDLAQNDLYDVTLNSDRLSVEEMSDSIMAMTAKRDLRIMLSGEAKNTGAINHQSATPVFKNPTEEEFARILDMYGIEWMYEPKTFPIEWDSEGNIKMAFSPDFYLPKFNLYLELTVMNQKYVTAKNKKMKKVMELYPGTNIRIVYKKDFEELVSRLKFFGG